MQKYYVVVKSNGDIYWYSDPELQTSHRENGPAIEYDDGSKEYWIDGKKHRIDGPAREWANGDKEYWVNGKRHREDGPAIEWSNGDKSYWINNVWYTEENFIKKTQPFKELTVAQLEELLGYKVKIIK